MNQLYKLTFISLLFILATGFTNPNPPTSDSSNVGTAEPAGHAGVVLSATPVGSYTYLELDKGNEVIWIAGPATDVQKGDKIRTSTGAEMRDFYSKTLNRTFYSIIFVGTIEVEEAAAPVVNEVDKTTIDSAETASSPEVGAIEKAEGTYTLQEVFGKKESLNGKRITVRGKIVKSSGKILSKRWYHIQDGSSDAGEYADLVLTSDTEVSAGDVVQATGTLNLNRDLGGNYKYDVILEDAAINVLRESEDPVSHSH